MVCPSRRLISIFATSSSAGRLFDCQTAWPAGSHPLPSCSRLFPRSVSVSVCSDHRAPKQLLNAARHRGEIARKLLGTGNRSGRLSKAIYGERLSLCRSLPHSTAFTLPPYAHRPLPLDRDQMRLLRRHGARPHCPVASRLRERTRQCRMGHGRGSLETQKARSQ